MINTFSKQRSILFCLLSFVWVWLSFFINHLTEPSSQAMRMTGTGGVSVVGGGGNSTTSNFVKDRAQFFADKPIMGAKGPQTPVVTTTTHGGSSTLGGGNVTTSSSFSSARGLGGGDVSFQHSNTSVSDALRLRTKLAFEEANILDANGRLTEYAVSVSKPIKLKDPVIGNSVIVKELTKDGSCILDWVKYHTPKIKMPNKQWREIHFYKYETTGKINMYTLDFKVKWTIES